MLLWIRDRSPTGARGHPASAREPPPGDVGDSPRSRWLLAALLVAAIPVLLLIGRHQWFIWDEWWLLVHDGSLFSDALDGHNGHWFTLTRLAYRLTFGLWGLTAYWPYQLPVILLHLGTVLLLRAVMRRMGVRGWIATGAATPLVFFGSGRENILLAIQTSWNASLVCGLAMLLVADRDGPITRRDSIGLAFGLVGLLTSSLFLPLAVGVGVAVLVRRGWRAAAFYLVPPGAIFVAWYLRYGADSGEGPLLATETFQFMGRMLGATFWALAQNGWGGALPAMAAAVAVGISAREVLRGRSGRLCTPVPALLTAWVMFALFTALTRAGREFVGTAHSSQRYLYVGAVLLLPLIALGAEQMARRKAVLGGLPLLFLAVGVPGNVERLSDPSPTFPVGRPFGDVADHGRDVFLALPRSDYLEHVSGDVRPMASGPWYRDLPLTADWLRRHGADGRIPHPRHKDPRIALTADRVLVLDRGSSALSAACHDTAGPLPVTLEAGERLGFIGVVAVSLVDGTHESYPDHLDSEDGNLIEARAGPVDLILRGTFGSTVTVCIPTST